jgi:hypothetical protein
LVSSGFLHADVRLHGFYAYASLELGDITSFPGAVCGAVMSRVRGEVVGTPPRVVYELEGFGQFQVLKLPSLQAALLCVNHLPQMGTN